MKETGARLIIVDPVQSYLGATVDLHRCNETRPILDGLARLAEQYRCAIVLLRHLTKAEGGKAIHRGLGSIDLSAAARSELLVGSLPDAPETRALVHIKSNIGPLGTSLGFAIERDGHFKWTGPTKISAADLLAAPTGSKGSKVDEAAAWLDDLLTGGPREKKEVEALAEQQGFSMRTVRRAMEPANVESKKSSVTGAWIWRKRTPLQGGQLVILEGGQAGRLGKQGEDVQGGQGSHIGKLAALADDGHLRPAHDLTDNAAGDLFVEGD